ncbi:hypothetical protein [Prochlorothrix hollandica]|uniref:hypothetical protein n=1 Tax=Prochlorothrix hollandica TaxID=1223 RepID=UPI003340648F
MIKKFAKYFAGTLALLAALAFALNAGQAQSAEHIAMTDDGYVMVPMDKDHWEIQPQAQRDPNAPQAQVAFAADGDVPLDYDKNPAIPSSSPAGTYYGEKDAAWVRGATAYIKGLDDFSDGIIEYDVLLQRPEAGFIGLVVRAIDDGNHERFFMRPHHNTDSWDDSIQYTPVYNQLQSWQLYTGELYNSFFRYTYEDWIHCKLVLSGNSAEWFIRDMTKPAQYAPDLKRETPAGKVGLYALNPDRLGGLFANVKYKKMDKPPLMNDGVELPTAPPGNINTWERSEPFDEAWLKNKIMIMPADESMFTWTEFAADRLGIFAIHKLFTPVKEKNSVFIKKEIMSDRDQVKILQFGYSDRANVFLNGALQYIGDNTYRSRNRAFLGTAGYYDQVALDLKKGKNDLRIAVSAEALFTASWGGMAKFADTTGISFDE